MKLTLLLLLSTGRDIHLATSILLPSIINYFKLDELEEILIIIKNQDIELLNLRMEEFNNNITNNIKIRIINESTLMKTRNITNTYYLQMYLKLISSKIINTKYYITLDADVLFMNNTNINDFITENKCHFYKIKNKDTWMKRSIDFLDYTETIDYCINQTPFVFDKLLVEKMLSDIDVKKAILEKQCSEYTLFHVYLLKNNLFENNYLFSRFSNFPITFITSRLSNEQINKYLNILKKQKKPISIIQSRTNTHMRLTKSIKNIVPNSYYKKYKIAVLTCVTNNMYYERYKKAIEIKKKYCRYHNYTCLIYKMDDNNYELKNGWIKIYKLLELLHNYDYIFCSDADVIITNRDIRIEDIIFKYMREKHNMLITTDFNSINSGNIIWKNCKKSFAVLKKMLEIKDDKIRYTLKKPFIPKGIYEQPTLIYLINFYADFNNSIKIIPQYKINSYCKIFNKLTRQNIIKKIDDKINRTNWINGDFLVHLAGFNYIKNGNFVHKIENLIGKYIKRYYDKILHKEGIDSGKIK